MIPGEHVLESMYEDMVTARHYEERMQEEYLEGKQPAFDISAGPIPGELHLAAGQEAAAVGVCEHLEDPDTVTATHRPHHIAIAKGVDLNRMTAEIFGRETGLCRGKGGHMHLFDPEVNFACSGIVAQGAPPAVGAAMAARKRNQPHVAVAFLGEGATNQGGFYESLNLASVHNLPVVFVVEDNDWNISMPKSRVTAVENTAERARGQNMPGVQVEYNDATAVYEAAADAVGRARNGNGPTLMEVQVHRHMGHFMGDPQTYRPDEEIEWVQSIDPINRLEETMHEAGIDSSRIEQLQDRARDRVEEAIQFAKDQPLPDPEQAREHVFVNPASGATGDAPDLSPEDSDRDLTMSRAMVEAIHDEMENNNDVFIMGEDVADYGGIFDSTQGLLEEFGRDRVMDVPISETGFIGAAVGAAQQGMRPIAELMFVDFFGVCMDQIYHNMAKNTYMSGGAVNEPMVLMTAVGGTYNDAAQHSQTLYGTFAHLPGMKVVVPSTAFDAKGLMHNAIRDDDPVMYMFHKRLMGLAWMPAPEGPQTGVPEEDYLIPFGSADVKREGNDVTIVTLGLHVHRALEAATQLAQDGIEAEVIDLRTLVPLDEQAILTSVDKTGRLLVVDEDYRSFGLSGEIITRVAESDLSRLDACKRVTMPDAPIPYSRPLEDEVMPGAEDIAEAARSLS